METGLLHGILAIFPRKVKDIFCVKKSMIRDQFQITLIFVDIPPKISMKTCPHIDLQ